HEPFHWFIEFYGIMRAGGFDVIIGNPPYVEYSKVKKDYTILGYKTENSGNLYALCTERSLTLLRTDARFGFIVQQPITSTLRMANCRQVLVQKTTDLWVSTFDDRPSKLFDGMHHARLAIILARVNDIEIPAPRIFVTSYNKWSKYERIFLFAKLQFINIEPKILDGVFPKFGTELETELVGKVLVGRKPLETCLAQSLTPHCLFYKITGVGNWFTITTRPPKFLRGESVSSSTREATIPFTTTQLRDIAFCLLNSSLFYWFYQVRTNCRDFNPSDFRTFPIPTTLENDRLDNLANQLSDRLDEQSMMVSASYQKTGNVSYEQFRPGAAKDLIDKIDAVLAQHYGFTDEELDFIINYDIKYRMGSVVGEDGDDE
ncbi:MAG: SAM-dependent methyltransferase, partial [Candidatus Competibacteraceae bacterium]